MKFTKRKVFLISFIFLLFFIFSLFSCVASDSSITNNNKGLDNNKESFDKKTNENERNKFYENSFFQDILLPSSVKALNLSIKIPFTLNSDKYGDFEYYENKAKDDNKAKNEIKNLFLHYQLYLPENMASENIKGKFLLVHGFAGSTFTYHTLAPMLAKQGFVVVSIDLPNFGYSERVKLKLNSNCFADIIYSFLIEFDKQNKNILKGNTGKIESIENIVKIENQKWNIIGHSMSGRILTVFAYKYKQMIQNLMLISPAFFGSRNLPILAKIPPFNFLLNSYINNLLKRENFAKLLEKVYLRKPEDYEIDSYLKPLLIKDTFKNVLYMLDVVEDVDFNPPAILSKIDMPILLIWGKKDSIVPLKNSYKFIKSIKDKKLIEIDDCGHNAMETHTDIVFESIMNFINFN